jgi:calcineurin-like phosphoesterase family protein
MTVFFTSDLHFDHANIIKYCNRPFSSVEEMRETLIKNYNKVVKPNDTVYNLGDVSMKANYEQLAHFFSRLNGAHIILRGNHDSDKHFIELAKNGIIQSYNEAIGASINGQYIWMSHYAHRVWNLSHRGSWHIYGHSHGSLPPYGLSYDVGVDGNNYAPVSFDQLAVIMKDLKDKHEAAMMGVYS